MKESEGLYRSFRFIKRAIIGSVVVVAGMAVFGYAVFMRTVDARGAWTAASRELNGGMLHFGERVERYAKAYQRRPTDYYRATSGLLVATNDRVIFIGVAPTDKLANEDAPATILQYEFPNDTLLSLDKQRLYGLTAGGVVISHGDGRKGEFAAAEGAEASLDSLIDHVNTRLVAQKTEAAREVRIRAAAAAVVDEPIYYVVKRGDALSTISKRFDTTPEQIREWNNLPGDRVRIGQQLTVKPKGRRQEPLAAPAVAPAPVPAR